jgi:hypothetical protein
MRAISTFGTRIRNGLSRPSPAAERTYPAVRRVVASRVFWGNVDFFDLPGGRKKRLERESIGLREKRLSPRAPSSRLSRVANNPAVRILTSAVYLPPFASRTRPRYASVRHGKAAWLHSKLPRRSAPPIGEQRSRASPVRSSRRNMPSEPRFQGGGKSYGLCRATTRSIDLRTSEVRARWAPACTAIQAKKIMLGVHDTISPSKNP